MPDQVLNQVQDDVVRHDGNWMLNQVQDDVVRHDEIAGRARNDGRRVQDD